MKGGRGGGGRGGGGGGEAKRGNPDGGVEHLLRAYMLDGDRIFLEEVDGPQYLAMLGSRGLL